MLLEHAKDLKEMVKENGNYDEGYLINMTKDLIEQINFMNYSLLEIEDGDTIKEMILTELALYQTMEICVKRMIENKEN